MIVERTVDLCVVLTSAGSLRDSTGMMRMLLLVIMVSSGYEIRSD